MRRPNIRSPTTRKVAIRKKDRPILRLDSHLMPLPTPDRAERVEAPTIITSTITMAAAEALSSSFNSQPASNTL